MGSQLLELCYHLLGFAGNNGIVDFALVLEICVYCAATFVGGFGNIVHSGVFNAVVGI